MFLSPVKLMVIVAVVLLLMGPDKLPEVAHRLGSSWRALKRLQERVESEVRDALPDLPSTGDIARIVRSPINLLNQLSDSVDAKEAAELRKNAPPVAPAESAPLITPPSRPTPARTESSTLPPDPSLN
ncbi:MAG: twin-arginine translocase TatA/TatE family subunit [Acidimicrobiales bacterium]|jgi:TatA/E family protein of Tat protein translocase